MSNFIVFSNEDSQPINEYYLELGAVTDDHYSLRYNEDGLQTEVFLDRKIFHINKFYVIEVLEYEDGDSELHNKIFISMEDMEQYIRQVDGVIDWTHYEFDTYEEAYKFIYEK